MNALFRARWPACIIATFVCGCAAQETTSADTDHHTGCDEPRMVAAERAAQKRFTELHWVNCPMATRATVER